MYDSTKRDGRHSLGDPADILYLFSVSLRHVLS